MTVARVIQFPPRPVIAALDLLEGGAGNVDEETLAASIVLAAIRRGDTVPSWSVRVLLSLLYRRLETPFSTRLAEALAPIATDEVIAVGKRLLQQPQHRSLGRRLLPVT